MMTLRYYWERSKIACLLVLLLIVAAAIAGMQTYRRSRARAIRRAADQLQSGDRTRVAMQKADQQRQQHLDIARQHAEAAQQLEMNMQDIATLMRDEGHPKMAELVRRWNRG